MRDPAPLTSSTRSLLLLVLTDLVGQMASLRQWRDTMDRRFMAMEGRLSVIEAKILTQAWSIMTPHPESSAPPMSTRIVGRLRQGWGWLRQNLSFVFLIYRIWRSVPWMVVAAAGGGLWVLVKRLLGWS